MFLIDTYISDPYDEELSEKQKIIRELNHEESGLICGPDDIDLNTFEYVNCLMGPPDDDEYLIDPPPE